MSAPSKKSDPVGSVCFLLAELFSREIDKDMLDLLQLPEVRDVIKAVSPDVESDLSAEWDTARFEEYAVEFCRLFVYPGVCAPRADRWAKGHEDEQFSIRRWFDDETAFPEFPSRIAELPDSYIAKILTVRAGLAGATDELVVDYDAQMIHPWADSFAHALEEQCQLPIYKAIPAILRALVK